MLEMPNKNKFFTHEKNYNKIIEFSKAVNAEVSLVKVKEANVVVNLSKLAPAICETTDSAEKPDFEIIETKITKKRRTRRVKKSNLIKNYIRKALLKGHSVSPRLVAKKYEKYNLTAASYCIYLKTVREELGRKGYQFSKVGHGEYKIKRDTPA